MSDAFWLALLAAIPPTLAALAALFVSMRTDAKTDVVIGHVNSASTKAQGEIQALRHELELMRVQAAETKQTAAVLAAHAGPTNE
jgi:hypothetical protein